MLSRNGAKLLEKVVPLLENGAIPTRAASTLGTAPEVREKLGRIDHEPHPTSSEEIVKSERNELPLGNAGMKLIDKDKLDRIPKQPNPEPTHSEEVVREEPGGDVPPPPRVPPTHTHHPAHQPRK
ncbi:unnamed protein product [Bursaphelenchus okinawaensis]|uniref:Uncharacterized protein n=1 Tax=Bursaphelenchus okinawaensis TaxID=465554 RepID=A0A811KM50_9BILA|nr:unnamed protein product [Bursaphelenchus okinawaensis]CAG9106178.1 unnamed protein product [Bursaphelenchus okinawaensis]